MPTKPTPQKTLKQEKYWYIDRDGKTVYYDVAKDVQAGWWLKINTKQNDDEKSKQ
jgi:hypothetical protein